MTVRHFLKLDDLGQDELIALMDQGIELKREWVEGRSENTLSGRVLAMIFDKSSTRTRVSFEAGMLQLGGNAIFLSVTDTQLGRGEPLKDTARILSQMVDAVMIRISKHEEIVHFSKYSSVPVINGLSDDYHPCQLLADMQTYYEHRGKIEGRTVAWVGDGNNVCHSYIQAAGLYGFRLRYACPLGYQPDEEIVQNATGFVESCPEPAFAVEGCDLVVTDAWASMGKEQEAKRRAAIFAPYQVNAELMALAKSDALFMHCLPAYRGKEVTAEVIEGEQSIVWSEAANRLHAQKALLKFLLSRHG